MFQKLHKKSDLFKRVFSTAWPQRASTSIFSKQTKAVNLDEVHPLYSLYANDPSKDIFTNTSSVHELTTLDNGLRVLSIPSDTAVSSCGLYMNIEQNSFNNGIINLLDKLMYKSTTTRTDFRTVRECNELGASLTTNLSRETFALTGDVLRENISHVIATLLIKLLIQNMML